MQIIPAILTSDLLELDSLLRQVRDSKRYSRVQIDFVDGEYATNRTFKPMEADLIPYLPLKFDAHLMVIEKNVNQWVEEARLVGFDRIIVQMESVSRPEDFDCLALDVHSPVEAIEPYLSRLKLVNLMAIEPGFGGQKFGDEVIKQIKRLRRYEYGLCVDGGVEQEHLSVLEKLGVDEVAVGVKRVLEWI